MMSRERITKNLKRLGEKLEERGLTGELILAGGASMCLVHSARDMTKDVDALYEPKSDIDDIVREIAEENDLPPDWLNDSVKGFVTDKVQTMEFARFGALQVSTVTPRYLLAMKLMSARITGQDYNDIAYLFRELKITSAEDAQAIVEEYYPMNMILPKTQYVIEQVLEELQQDR